MPKIKSKRRKRKETIHSVAEYLIEQLKGSGIIIQRYDSKSSLSIYLKLDYGVLNSIRISDHKGKDHLKYKFNVLTVCRDFTSTKNQTVYGNVIRHYFPTWEKEKLLKMILDDRNNKISKYGASTYESLKGIKIAENYTKTGFWQNSEIV